MLKKISLIIGYISFKINNMIERCRNQYILNQTQTQGGAILVPSVLSHTLKMLF